ncbi:snake venom serine protease BmSP-like [Microplitis mediator]|uniref:snake venom serine protease BmSP-like n=1 Tax=Microplitis mediator TaxID=375433 RepID=UPI002552D3BF|nr:snake venom serine protease BmSP-like [Microplitis mediator]
MIKKFLIIFFIIKITTANHEIPRDQCTDELSEIVLDEAAAKGFARVNGADGIENTTNLVFIANTQGSPQYYPCPGVLLSKTHVLTSAHCTVDDHVLVITGYKFNLDEQTEEFINTTVSQVIQVPGASNLIILKMAKELRDDNERKILELPTRDSEVEKIYKIVGWSFTPGRDIFFDPFLIHEGDAKVTDTVSCTRTNSDELCMELINTTEEYNMIIGSPLIQNDQIMGFTHFNCNTKGPVTKVFPYVDEIKKIIS